MHTYLNNADLGQYYRVSQLLAYNRVSQIVFFLGQSLSKSSSLETFITEQDMRPNVFAFSVEHNTVSCLSCHLDQCHQQRNSDPSALCIGSHICPENKTRVTNLLFLHFRCSSPSVEFSKLEPRRAVFVPECSLLTIGPHGLDHLLGGHRSQGFHCQVWRFE